MLKSKNFTMPFFKILPHKKIRRFALFSLLTIGVLQVGYLTTINLHQKTQVQLLTNFGETQYAEDKTSVPSYSSCISLQSEMDQIINSSNQIFVLNAAKTGGTSMKAFTDKCVGDQDPYKDGHIINSVQHVEFRKSALIDSFSPPRLITAHIWKEDGFVNLMKQTSKKTLIIYCYRSETDRQIATMRQLISGALCKGVYTFFGTPIRSDYESIYEIRKDGSCVLDESRMVDLFSERRAEMDCPKEILKLNFPNSL